MTAPIASATAATATARAGERAQMQKVAKQFEAVFLRQMIGSMRQAGLADGMFDSSATDQFRDMADAKTADAMSETGGFGVAELLMRQFDARAVSTRAAPAGSEAASGEHAKGSAPPAVESGE